MKGKILQHFRCFCIAKRVSERYFAKNDIIKWNLYLILTHVDSASTDFSFVRTIHYSNTEDQCKKLIFQILTKSKPLERLEWSDKFWADFHVHDPKWNKQVGLYKPESIGNANNCICICNCTDNNCSKPKRALWRILQ